MRDDDLELRCVNSLAGASEVRNRLLSAITLGTAPTLDKLSYMVKCRVKTPTSLLDKVIDRRKDPKKANYQPADVRDIIGLRFLALYRKDLPELTSRFLEFVEAGQSDYLSLFSGTEIADCVEEVILYTTSPAEDNNAVDNQVVEVFASRGIFLKSPGEALERPTIRIERKDTKYSSLHIVLWCRNELGLRDGRRIPLEVQIRTAFEDVWGEIDHAINYKSGEVAETSHARGHHEIARGHLKNLKDFLNGCSSTADMIAKQMVLARPIEKSSSFPVSSFSVYPEKIASLQISDVHASTLVLVANDIKDTFRKVGVGEYAKNGGVTPLSKSFENCARKLVAIGEEIQGETSATSETSENNLYYVLMEAALCYYWAGRILTASDEPASMSEQIRQHYEHSLEVYSMLARNKAYSKDAILDFRMATTFSALNKDVQAREKYKDAVTNLSHPQRSLGERHFLRARIPRHLGVAYWEQAEKLREEAERLGYPDMFAESRRELYVDAIKTTISLRNMDFELPQQDMQFDPEDAVQERLKTHNNILEYALCFIRAGGKIEALEKLGLDQEGLEGFVTDLEGPEGVSEVMIPVWADTLRSAYSLFLGDDGKAKLAASRVLYLLGNNRDRWITRNGERFVREMERDAQETLDG